MERTGELGYDDYTVFAGSSEHDVMCSKIFWNSVTLQPPLESRLVSGDVEQRLRAAGEAKNLTRKNYTQQELKDLKTDYFLLEAQRVQDIEQRSIYMHKPGVDYNVFKEKPDPLLFIHSCTSVAGAQRGKAKRREEIIALLKKQREDCIKKDLVSFGHKLSNQMEEQRLTTLDIEEMEDIRAVRQLQ
ncbi:cilia- and flagella-associated protein HOATZ isoform X1 [Rhinoderma darwinii]|uniref:cilia- and flagella-associated protein HOATZ isoform X1 n=1 Tax=Rhinoderma darwinii TaxID=43563 RepID=UPI003F6639DC